MLFKVAQLFIALFSLLYFKAWKGENLWSTMRTFPFWTWPTSPFFRNSFASFEHATNPKLFRIAHVEYSGQTAPCPPELLPTWWFQGLTRYFEAIGCSYFWFGCTSTATSQSFSPKRYWFLCHVVRLSSLDDLPPALWISSQPLWHLFLSDFILSNSFDPGPLQQWLFSQCQRHRLWRTTHFINDLSLPFNISDELHIAVWHCLSLSVVDYDEHGLYHKSQQHSANGAASIEVYSLRLQIISDTQPWTESDVYTFRGCYLQSAQWRRPFHSLWFPHKRYPQIRERRLVGITRLTRCDCQLVSSSRWISSALLWHLSDSIPFFFLCYLLPDIGMLFLGFALLLHLPVCKIEVCYECIIITIGLLFLYFMCNRSDHKYIAS